MINFNGWEMPAYYTSIVEEHNAVREKAGLFDTCHMGEFFIEGKDAFELVQKLMTNDLDKLGDGKAFYTHMCLENGGIVDDLFVYRFDKERFMLVANAANFEKDFEWLLKQKDGFDVKIINKTKELAKIDVQGPISEEILQKLTNADLENLNRFYFVEDSVNDIPAIISRTGYTAEDGFELYFDVDKAVEIWDKLLETGKELGLKPAGLGARDVLRIEACYSLYSHELTEHINPFEANVGFVIKFDKKDFIGKQALQREKQDSKDKIMAFEMLDKAIPRKNYAVFKNDKEIGYVTSGTMSPTFKKGIGMAFVNIGEAKEGNEINIKIREKLYKARIVKRPFYAYHGKK